MKKSMRIETVVLLVGCLAALNACENTKRQLGLERTAPDEFAVLKRAPLAMPPDYTLRPPRPGAPRPQEMAPGEQAQEVVFGSEPAPRRQAAGTAEESLLQQAGADAARPNIRQIVDKETASLAPKQEPAVKKLLGLGKKQEPAASVVDAKAEAERLKKNADAGQSPAAGEIPSREE